MESLKEVVVMKPSLAVLCVIMLATPTPLLAAGQATPHVNTIIQATPPSVTMESRDAVTANEAQNSQISALFSFHPTHFVDDEIHLASVRVDPLGLLQSPASGSKRCRRRCVALIVMGSLVTVSGIGIYHEAQKQKLRPSKKLERIGLVVAVGGVGSIVAALTIGREP
jgi:hypothetical protein